MDSKEMAIAFSMTSVFHNKAVCGNRRSMRSACCRAGLLAGRVVAATAARWVAGFARGIFEIAVHGVSPDESLGEKSVRRLEGCLLQGRALCCASTDAVLIFVRTAAMKDLVHPQNERHAESAALR